MGFNKSKSRAFIANRYPAALQHDQTTSSNPIVNIENNNGKVDGHPKAGSSNIIYSKGGIILKNIRCFLGDEVFFGGLQNYLEEFKYSNPTTYDLTEAWEKKRNEVGKDQESATKNQSLCDGIGFNPEAGVLMNGKSVGDHWDPWLRQMGYPFLTVKYTDENTKGKVQVQSTVIIREKFICQNHPILRKSDEVTRNRYLTIIFLNKNLKKKE